MRTQLRLMAVLAHPDDEALALGGTLAKYAAEGAHLSLVTATRGERGWTGDPGMHPGFERFGQTREAELRCACAELGVCRLSLLDQIDGELSRAPAGEIVSRLVCEIREVRPDVVVTFGPEGVYGHPDHIAISQLTTTAVMSAADPGFPSRNGLEPHVVSKLYYRIFTAAEAAVFRPIFGDVGIDVDGRRRTWHEWPEWAASARLDTADYWSEVQSAALCHPSQVGGNATLRDLEPRDLRVLWGTQQFYRVISTVDTSEGIETDLFAGLRRSQGLRSSPKPAVYVLRQE